MLKFQPSGFGQQIVEVSLGRVVYYTAIGEPWTTRDGKPPIIFLHSFGGGASAYEWSKVYPAFANTYRVIAPDLLGWGQSSHPKRAYQLDDYLTSITEFIQQATSTPVILVAASFAGAIAVRLAVQKPALFQSLYLVCPSGFADFGESPGRRIPQPIIDIPGLDRLIYTIGAMNEMAVRNFLEQFLFVNQDRVTPEMVAAYLTSAQQPNGEYAALSFLRGDLYFDLSLDIPKLKVPTAIAWGMQSQFTPLNLGRRLAALNSQQVQRFQPISDTGILPHLEQPAVITGLLFDWLQEIPS